MLTRLSRLGPVVPRLLSNPPARFVSQSKPTEAAGSTAVTELHPAGTHSGHSEVSQYVKVSFFARQASDIDRPKVVFNMTLTAHWSQSNQSKHVHTYVYAVSHDHSVEAQSSLLAC